jgi:hypothetical protein
MAMKSSIVFPCFLWKRGDFIIIMNRGLKRKKSKNSFIPLKMGHCKKCYQPKYLCCCVPCPKPCQPSYDRFCAYEPPHVSGTWKLSLKTWSNSFDPVDCSQIENQTKDDPLVLEVTQCSKPNNHFASAVVKRGPLSGQQFVGVFKKSGNDRLPFWELILTGNGGPTTLTLNFVGDDRCPHRVNFILVQLAATEEQVSLVGAGKGKRVARHPH